MVVEEASVRREQGSLPRQQFFETFGRRDARERRDTLAGERGHRQPERTVDLDEFLRAVRAGDDLRLGIVPSDERDEGRIGRPDRFRQEDIGGAAQVGDRLAQHPAGQQGAVAERIAAVHEQQVDLAAQRQILQTVVEQDGVHAEATQGEAPALDAVAVDDDHDAVAAQVLREHVRFVAGFIRTDEHRATVRHDQRIGPAHLGQPAPETFHHRIRSSFVASRKDRDAATAGRQDLRHLQHDRRLTRPADRQITDDHHLAAQGRVTEHPVAVKPETQPDQDFEDPGQDLEKSPEQGRPDPAPPSVDYVYGIARDRLS